MQWPLPMKIQSLIRENDRLVPVEVEISFLPGLPQIQFLGLPDQVIKESIFRIKSALRSQGFEFPKANHILVNLRPSHLKKSSRGLELAVALGLIWESQQAPAPSDESVMVYGELSLSGQVHEPDDLCVDAELPPEQIVWTGASANFNVPFRRLCLKNLQDVASPDYLPAVSRVYDIERPQFGLNLKFSERQAELLSLIALGEHSLLLAGPAGSGKSTLAKTVLSLLREPTAQEMSEIIRNNKNPGQAPPKWRPMIHPHHSTTPLGLIGGGVPPFKGDISKAHKGVLVLDELLEFHPRAQEALREPMEEYCIRLRKGRFVEEHPAETLVVSTTNLCPCGDWVPRAKVVCGRSIRKCQSYMERLSGPLVDRFQVIYFTQKREEGVSVLGSEILQRLERARLFRSVQAEKDPRFLKVTSFWAWEELVADLPTFYMRELFPKEIVSRRRDLATLRVARSLADLDGVEVMLPEYVERALKITYTPFEALKRLGG